MSKYFPLLVSEIVAQSKEAISENEAMQLANYDGQKLDRYVDVLEGTVSEWAAEIVKDEMASRQALSQWDANEP